MIRSATNLIVTREYSTTALKFHDPPRGFPLAAKGVNREQAPCRPVSNVLLAWTRRFSRGKTSLFLLDAILAGEGQRDFSKMTFWRAAGLK